MEAEKDWRLKTGDRDRKDLVFFIWPIDLELMRWQK
jgi:hypothetical protein